MRDYFVCIAGWWLLTTIALAQAPAPSTSKAAAIARPNVTTGILSAKTEHVAPNRAAITIATKPDAKLRLLDAAGKEVAVARTTDGTIKAEVDPQRGYQLTPPPQERRSLPKEGLQFPVRYVTMKQTSPSSVATNLGGLFLRPAIVPLTWNDQTHAYATDIFVGYEFEDGAERPLAAPKTVTFFAEGSNARIKEDTVTIERSGGSGYKRVVLSTGQLEGETHFTARASPTDELKASVAIQREPGALQLSLPSTELPAFGVGSATLTVTLLGRDGFPFAASRPVDIQLSSRRLRQPPVISIDQGKSTATADIRTTGSGTDEVIATSGAFRAALPIKLVFPIAPIVAALVGGALGGSARYLRNKGKRQSLLVRRVIEGMLVGLILVAATWAGLVSVDVSTGILGTPFGAFVLGALSGYLGCVVLDQVAKKTFGGAKAEA
jgi:hypothetical protein